MPTGICNYLYFSKNLILFSRFGFSLGASGIFGFSIDFAKAAQERLGLSTTPVFANSEFELETGELIAKDEVIKEVIDEEGLTNLRSKIADIQKGVDNILGQTDSALSKEMSAEKLTQINNILQELEKVSLNLGSTVTKG